ncbi:hypothetical protein AOQ84DRAFT_396608 [Glonium stellatum]|uniref:Cytochrome P450 n=1 Tax=Glonium stellatum TaxID=574774 RepID=A0A8E2F5J1_9PEZI|nr:hypothetical protein AOQ84DRAFT_396608 [Glonium stellatum]
MAILKGSEATEYSNLSPLLIVFFLAAAIAFTYIFGIIIYRLYFHPLARYPRPLLTPISPIPITFSLIRGRIPFFMEFCHDRYGPVVRISPNELCFDEKSSWKDIYGSGPGHKNFHKDPIHVGSIQAVPDVSTITMANDADDARQRRALSHAFSTKALSEQEYIVMSYVDVFSNKMREFAAKGQGSRAKCITNWLDIGDMALGEPFGYLKNENFRFWVPLISDSIKAGAFEQATRRMATAGSPLQRFLLWCIPDLISSTRRSYFK